MPGVVAAYTGKDMAQGGVGPLPCGWLLPDIKIPEYRGVATDKVNFVGHAVAVVIGETPVRGPGRRRPGRGRLRRAPRGDGRGEGRAAQGRPRSTTTPLAT